MKIETVIDPAANDLVIDDGMGILLKQGCSGFDLNTIDLNVTWL
jgi:hypothetical protein